MCKFLRSLSHRGVFLLSRLLIYFFSFFFLVLHSKTSRNRPGQNSLPVQNHDSEKERENAAKKQQEWWDKGEKEGSAEKGQRSWKESDPWRCAQYPPPPTTLPQHHHHHHPIPTSSGHEVSQTWAFSPWKKKKTPNVFVSSSKESLWSNYHHIVGERKLAASSSTLGSEKSPANIFSLSSLPAAGVIPWSARDVPCQNFFYSGGKKRRCWFGLPGAVDDTVRSAVCRLSACILPIRPPPRVYPLVFNSCGVRCGLG